MSALYEGMLWPLAILVWPLLLGLVPVVPRWRGKALWLLPLAPLPALVFAISGAPGHLALPDVLLGVQLASGPDGAMFLGMTALVWAVAGLHAALTLPHSTKAGILAGFWCLTLAGNLAVFLAADIVTFYLAFAVVSLAAWFLVIHERTEKALAAGRLYITLAVLGEAALLVGLLIGAAAADDMQIASVRSALPDAPFGPLAIGLLITGFGIKAGMVPLHIWLPVAHPAAPVPGSAVLSGAIVKAGLIGMMLFIPTATGWGDSLIVAGLAGAFGAALWGLTQQNPKAVLAYSTISQMGLMLALVGAGSQGIAFYALHHGLAKTCLFLSVGIIAAATSPRQRRLTLCLAGLVSASVAGVPLTGGALVKLAGKSDMPDWLALAITASSITTTLVLGWFVIRLSAQSSQAKSPARWHSLILGPAALAGLVLALPWAMWAKATGLAVGYPLTAGNLFDGIWPVLLGLAATMLVARRHAPSYPPGDILAIVAWGRVRLNTIPEAVLQWHPRPPKINTRALLRLLIKARKFDGRLQQWPIAGLILTTMALAIALLTALPR